VEAGPHAGKIDFCVCDGRPTLVWMAQLASIELHPSLSLSRAPKRPTVLAFDLDPGLPADIVDCCRVGLRLRDMFGHFGVQSFPKTSGSKGMQVYIPLNEKASYDVTKPFAKAIAQLLEKQTPDLVVSKMKKVEREGKVFVDWSQNHQRKTTIAVYSLRARERPTVSTPITWEEVEAAADSGDGSSLVFETGDVLERIEEHGDLFAPVLELRQELPEL
jgi:bifunctional non-homologous end joining protein LigD